MKKLSFFLMAMLFSVMSFAAEVTVKISDYATTNGWKDATQYKTLKMDDNVSITVAGSSNTGKYYVNGNNWRMYQNESPKITLTATNGNLLKTVKFTYAVNNTGILVDASKAQVKSGTVYTFADEVTTYTFGVGNTGTATNGQVRFTEITVVYDAPTPSDPDAVKYTVTAKVNDPAMGTVSGAGEIEEGKTATLTANANAGYKFVNWSNGSTDNPLKITVTEDVEITANFEVIPTMTCAEAAAAAKGATVVLNPFDVVYVVKGAGYTYIKDDSGVNLIFDYTMDDQFKAGDHVEGFVGTSSPYNGLPEIKPTVSFADLKVTPGTAPEATVFETVPAKEDVNKYVVFKGVKLTSDINYNTSSATNATISVGGKNVTLRNNFKLAASLTSGSTYDIYAFVAVYNSSLQMYYASSVDVSPERTITATVNPAETGTVTGAGTYKEGKTATLKATPAEGYAFTCWTEGEDTVSTAANYSFKVAADRALVANFAKKTYNVTVTAENGTVTGAGEYIENAEVTLEATPAEGYEFTCWTSGEDTVSTANPYTFAVTANVALVANFNKKAEPEHTYTVAGSSETAFGTTWDPANDDNDMKKQEDGTYKWEKEGLELLAGEVAFKVTEDHAWTVAYPAQDYKLAIAENGIYTLTITFNPADKAVAATATKTGDVGKIIPTIAMHGNFLGEWKDTENFTLAADEATATLTLTIAEGNYEFGMRIGGSGNWTSNGVAFTRENASAEIVAGSGNLKFAADVAGEYTFTWTFETNTLTVTYPALVTAIEVNVTGATSTSGEWSIDLAGSWNDQALTIKLWQDNTQGFGSYAPNAETGYYILLGAKELTPTTEGVYADNGDGTFTFTCSATEGTTQYNITVTGTSGAQEVHYETFVLTNLMVTDNETFLVLSASDMNMGLEVTLGVNMDGTLMDASQIFFGGKELPILSSEPVTVTFNEELLTDVYTARVVVEHMGEQLGLELIMYAGGATSEPIAVNVIGATAAVDEATDVLKITGNWDGIAFELRINAYDPAQTLYDAPQIAEFETEEVYAISNLVTVIKTGENIDVIGEFMSPMGDIYNVYVNAIFAAGPETGVDNINTTVAPVKVIENGQIFIISNGVKYNAQGAQL